MAEKGAKSLHNLPRSMEVLINAGAKIRIGKNRVSTDLDKAMRDEEEKKIIDLLEARIERGQSDETWIRKIVMKSC